MLTLPISGFVSVVSLAVYWLPGDGIQLTPGLPFCLVDFAFLLFRELLVRNEFFHICYLLMVSEIIIAKTPGIIIKDL